ncbi:MAG: M14 family metallopeptidase [Cyanobacteriota bacterium]|nr:M14 family metallopeptidase [Cyanobacteriota bacterium]
MLESTDLFPPDYFSARRRFRQLASTLGCRLEACEIDATGPDGETLTVDVAYLGPDRPHTAIVLSSGLHGVEGFFGSAVQSALLQHYLPQWLPLPEKTALILLHAVNPYGFAWRRRCNEDNIDLNRNFLVDGQAYGGSPARYGEFDRFFNPPSPPNQLDPFLAKTLTLALRYGIATLKNTLPVGQYDFPKGLFYGGAGPSQTQQIMAEHLPGWIGPAQWVVHIDLHTGLGKPGTYKLLLGESSKPDRVKWLTSKFGADLVEISQPDKTSYRTRGSWGHWCRQTFSDRCYDFLLAEFGTYPVLAVVKALRAENRAHWWGEPGSPAYERAKEQLVEAFAPADRLWREQVVAAGVDLVRQALNLKQSSDRSGY